MGRRARDRVAQRLLGEVVGGRHAVDAQEGEELVVVAAWIEHALAQVFSLRVRKGGFVDSVQLLVERWDVGSGLGEGDLAFVPETAQLAGVGEELAQALAKSAGRGALALPRQSVDEQLDFPGFTD